VESLGRLLEDSRGDAVGHVCELAEQRGVEGIRHDEVLQCGEMDG